MFWFRHKPFIISVVEVCPPVPNGYVRAGRPPPIMGTVPTRPDESVRTGVNVPINIFAYQTHRGGNLKVSATVGNRSLPGGR